MKSSINPEKVRERIENALCNEMLTTNKKLVDYLYDIVDEEVQKSEARIAKKMITLADEWKMDSEYEGESPTMGPETAYENCQGQLRHYFKSGRFEP